MSMAAERLQVIKGHIQNGRQNLGDEKKFRYTIKSNPLLTEDDRVFYEENGYVVEKNLVPHDLLDKWSKRFVDMCDGKISPGRSILMKDLSLLKAGVTGEKAIYKLQDFMWDDVFWEFISLPRICDLVECIVGPNLTAMNTMLINKPPDSGTASSRHPLHQDLYYFPFRPADRIVCAWTAMERVTRDNGCLVVIPGTHRGMCLPHDYPEWENGVNKMYHGVKGFDSHDRVHLRMEKGDTVFFHPTLIHGSGTNRTKGCRKAISCHYAASECNYIDITGTHTDLVAEEAMEVAKRKLQSEESKFDYADLWKIRSRHVRGLEINL